MIRVGAVDCGTNSIRLLIADLDDAGGLTQLSREMEIVRLGQGVDRTGRLADDALARTLTAARRYAAACTEAGCDSVRFVATSATRDAENADEFAEGVARAFEAFGTNVEVISGTEEAALSFAGATVDLRHDGVPGPYLVVDIGGGSTEFVLGTVAVEQSASMDIGCVRLTERHLLDDPPGEDQIWPALGDITIAIGEAADEVDFSTAAVLVGVAGSVTTVTADALGLAAYDSDAIHGSQLPVDRVIDACSDLVRLSRAQRRELPYMHPGRVDVIGAGALIWRTVIQRVVHDAGIATVRTSERDILDGIALSQAR